MKKPVNFPLLVVKENLLLSLVNKSKHFGVRFGDRLLQFHWLFIVQHANLEKKLVAIIRQRYKLYRSVVAKMPHSLIKRLNSYY